MAAVLPCWNCYHKASRISYEYWDHVTLLYLGYHDKYYMVMTLSYFCNGNRCTGKVASLPINIHMDEIRQSCYLISMDGMCFLIRWHNSYAKYGYTIAQPYLLFANRLQIAECHTLLCPGFVCLTYVLLLLIMLVLLLFGVISGNIMSLIFKFWYQFWFQNKTSTFLQLLFLC